MVDTFRGLSRGLLAAEIKKIKKTTLLPTLFMTGVITLKKDREDSVPPLTHGHFPKD